LIKGRAKGWPQGGALFEKLGEDRTNHTERKLARRRKCGKIIVGGIGGTEGLEQDMTGRRQ